MTFEQKKAEAPHTTIITLPPSQVGGSVINLPDRAEVAAAVKIMDAEFAVRGYRMVPVRL